MPRSILAMRSLWRWIMATIAIAPPTRIAQIGINSGPKPRTESINLLIRRLPQGLKPFSFRSANAALKGRSSTILVELTGIEPVASWLQTRRSPS
jgi:hypothetical protein